LCRHESDDGLLEVKAKSYLDEFGTKDLAALMNLDEDTIVKELGGRYVKAF
jgi:hypothetical protein